MTRGVLGSAGVSTSMPMPARMTRDALEPDVLAGGILVREHQRHLDALRQQRAQATHTHVVVGEHHGARRVAHATSRLVLASLEHRARRCSAAAAAPPRRCGRRIRPAVRHPNSAMPISRNAIANSVNTPLGSGSATDQAAHDQACTNSTRQQRNRECRAPKTSASARSRSRSSDRSSACISWQQRILRLPGAAFLVRDLDLGRPHRRRYRRVPA